jgi:rSAM/selenodomain-associated transferase 1
MSKQLLIVFLKNIRLGNVKTRLAKSIGDKDALEVYKGLVQITKNASCNLNLTRHIYFSDVIINTEWKKDQKFIQSGTNIGERMENAFLKGFELGFEHIILIGSDLPDISEHIITDAFNKLIKNDTVFGPAEDGGYYLVGMKNKPNRIFKDKPWSQPNLMNKTSKQLKEDNLSLSLLQRLNDIDNIEDLNKSSLDSKYKVIKKAE